MDAVGPEAVHKTLKALVMADRYLQDRCACRRPCGWKHGAVASRTPPFAWTGFIFHEPIHWPLAPTRHGLRRRHGLHRPCRLLRCHGLRKPHMGCTDLVPVAGPMWLAPIPKPAPT